MGKKKVTREGSQIMTFSRIWVFCQPSQNRNKQKWVRGQAEHVLLWAGKGSGPGWACVSVSWKGVGARLNICVCELKKAREAYQSVSKTSNVADKMHEGVKDFLQEWRNKAIRGSVGCLGTRPPFLFIYMQGAGHQLTGIVLDPKHRIALPQRSLQRVFHSG